MSRSIRLSPELVAGAYDLLDPPYVDPEWLKSGMANITTKTEPAPLKKGVRRDQATDNLPGIGVRQLAAELLSARVCISN